MYIAILGYSDLLELDLMNTSQLGWFTMPTRVSSLQFEELGIEWIKDQEGSWIKMISKLVLTSKIVLMSRKFFWTFCEKILISLQIIFCCHSLLNKLTFFNFHKV